MLPELGSTTLISVSGMGPPTVPKTCTGVICVSFTSPENLSFKLNC